MISAICSDVGLVHIDILPNRGLRHIAGLLQKDNCILGRNEAELAMANARALVFKPAGRQVIADKDLYQGFITALADQGIAYSGNLAQLRLAVSDNFVPFPHRIRLLNELARRFPAALVSDTVGWHASHLESTMPQLYRGIPKQRRIYSHEVGYRKEDGPAIYALAMDALGIPAAEILMIDDLEANRAGAEALGMHFMCIQKVENLAERLAQEYDILLRAAA